MDNHSSWPWRREDAAHGALKDLNVFHGSLTVNNVTYSDSVYKYIFQTNYSQSQVCDNKLNAVICCRYSKQKRFCSEFQYFELNFKVTTKMQIVERVEFK